LSGVTGQFYLCGIIHITPSGNLRNIKFFFGRSLSLPVLREFFAKSKITHFTRMCNRLPFLDGW
jgi:hypothetical protein